MTSRRRILITNGTADCGLAAARSLSAAGYEVMSADVRCPFTLRSRYVARHYPLPQDSADAFASALLAAVRDCRPAALLPIGTRPVYAVARRQPEFAAATALNLPSLAAFRAAYVKSACLAECRALGIPGPQVLSQREASALLEGGGARVVVKPDAAVGGAGGVEYVGTPGELHAAIARCRAAYGRVLIQEYIPGGPEAMKTLVVLFTRDARLAAAFTTRKARQWPPEGGVSAASCSTGERSLVDLVLPLFRKWRWTGAAEVELKLDTRDGVHKLIEVNPRFPGYLRFAGHCGLDLPLLAVRLALDEGDNLPPLFAYRTGARFVSPGAFARALLRDLRRAPPGLDALRAGWRELDGTGALLRAMLTDPLPLAGRIVRGALRPRASWPSFPIDA
jgi:D-aspartate ligase